MAFAYIPRGKYWDSSGNKMGIVECVRWSHRGLKVRSIDFKCKGYCLQFQDVAGARVILLSHNSWKIPCGLITDDGKIWIQKGEK